MFNLSKERKKERERERVGGNELPTSITDNNTYQKRRRRRRRRTTSTSSPGEVIFGYSFNRSTERESGW